jgi:hypothetical protein
VEGRHRERTLNSCSRHGHHHMLLRLDSLYVRLICGLTILLHVVPARDVRNDSISHISVPSPATGQFQRQQFVSSVVSHSIATGLHVIDRLKPGCFNPRLLDFGLH